MRLCRILVDGQASPGFYNDRFITPLASAAELYRKRNGGSLSLPQSDDLLVYLPPKGTGYLAASTLHDWLVSQPTGALTDISIDVEKSQLLLPVPRPPKLFLLAANYADHIKESGSTFEERAHTFPYFFMKPPSTTLLDPCASLRLPEVSPGHVDWEIELAAVMGATVKHVTEAEALGAVAGYTILNDISDRHFRPNPKRRTRDWDKFFDWMHGKWHDGFAPCGPCIASSDAIPDPQSLTLCLELNGEARQKASTANQIFPLDAAIAFISQLVTLEAGDIISTGTPAGVGSSTGTFLRSGDILVARISGIGKLVTTVG